MLQGRRILKMDRVAMLGQVACRHLKSRGAGSAGSAGSVGSAGSDMGALGELGELLGELNPHHNQNPIHDQVTGDARWNGPGDVRWNGGGGQASIMMVMAKAASPAGWRGRVGHRTR